MANGHPHQRPQAPHPGAPWTPQAIERERQGIQQAIATHGIDKWTSRFRIAALALLPFGLYGGIRAGYERILYGARIKTWEPTELTEKQEEEELRKAKADKNDKACQRGPIVFDESGQQVLCGENTEGLSSAPLGIIQKHAGVGPVLARRDIMKRFLGGSAHAKRVTGKHIGLSPSESRAWRQVRTQAGIKDKKTIDLFGVNLWETGAAGSAHGSFHVAGRAFDLSGYATREGLPWWLSWAFMKEQGFKCGPETPATLSHWDLWHCDDRETSLSQAQIRENWFDRCGQHPDRCPPDWRTHQWQGTVEEVEAYLRKYEKREEDQAKRLEEQEKAKEERERKREEEKEKKAKKKAEKESRRKNRRSK